MERKEFEFKISDRRLQAYSYDCPEPKAVVILIHGMGEYARRYERSVIPALHQASIRVLCFDQFGHGRSSGKRGAHPGFEILLDCVNHVITLESSRNSDLPVILYGHSMGGNVAANYALRRPGKIDGLILTSPFLSALL